MVSAPDGSSTRPHCRSGYGRGSVLHVLSGHNPRHKSVIQAQKRAANFLRYRWKAILGASNNVRLICSHSDMLRKYLHRIRHRIRHRMLYIVYDIVGIHDVVYDIIYCTSYTTSYTMSYARSFFTTTEIYSAGLTAPASRLRFRVSAPLRLESSTRFCLIASASATEIFLGNALP